MDQPKLTKQEIMDKMADLEAQLLSLGKENNTSGLDGNIKIKCDICGGKYTVKNKSSHAKTKRHIKDLENLKTMRRIARSRTLQGRAGGP